MGSKKQKGRGKNGQKERAQRREQKRQKKAGADLKKANAGLEKALKEVRKMSGLVGPDGKTPIQSDLPKKKFRAGGLQFDTVMTPDMLLTKALQGAQQAVANQAYQQTMQQTKSAVAAQSAATTAASSCGDPFTLEPSAMAVFMYLAREVEYRDKIIEQLNDRLVKLGAEPLDLTHPYPVPDPPPPEEDEDGEGEDGEEESETPPSSLVN